VPVHLSEPAVTDHLRTFVDTIRRACNQFDEASATTNSRLGHVRHLCAASAATLDHAIGGGSASGSSDGSSTGAAERIRECETIIRQLETSSATFVDQLQKLSQELLATCGQLDEAFAETRSLGRIAREARILALNGRIEARRAGEAGRGFGVVAEGLHDLAVAAHRTRAHLEQTSLTQTAQLRALCDSIQGLSESAGADRELASRRVEDLLADLGRTGADLEGAIVSGTLTSQEVCEQLAEIVLENQRIDRGRQLILTACRALDDIVAADETSDVDPATLDERLDAAYTMIASLEQPIEEHEPELF
jgi:methyl-accepting chemotaxis protein